MASWCNGRASESRSIAHDFSSQLCRYQVTTLGQFFTRTYFCNQAVEIGASESCEVNRQLYVNDTLAPCLWSCNFGWCLTEGLESLTTFLKLLKTFYFRVAFSDTPPTTPAPQI